MDLERAKRAISHNPLAFKWGVRGKIDVPYPTDSAGKRICRWCHGELIGRRTSWCGQACVDAYTMRSHWSTMRVYILRRDKHLCVACLDPGHEVDHELAVCEGGTDDPANLRLLCVPCHKMATYDLNRRRVAERRGLVLQLEHR